MTIATSTRSDAYKRGQGKRGKFAEGKVRKFLDDLGNSSADFDWSRIYDARSAGGRFPSRPGDFEFYRPGIHGLIEVKEVNHDYRLPSKNFKREQIAKLRKRQLAGGSIVVLVYHTTSKLWRYVPLQHFIEHLKEPSWVLEEFPTSDSHKTLLAELTHDGRRIFA